MISYEIISRPHHVCLDGSTFGRPWHSSTLIGRLCQSVISFLFRFSVLHLSCRLRPLIHLSSSVWSIFLLGCKPIFALLARASTGSTGEGGTCLPIWEFWQGSIQLHAQLAGCGTSAASLHSVACTAIFMSAANIFTMCMHNHLMSFAPGLPRSSFRDRRCW